MSEHPKRTDVQAKVWAADRRYFQRNPDKQIRYRGYVPGELGKQRPSFQVSHVVVEQLASGIRRRQYVPVSGQTNNECCVRTVMQPNAYKT